MFVDEKWNGRRINWSKHDELIAPVDSFVCALNMLLLNNERAKQNE